MEQLHAPPGNNMAAARSASWEGPARVPGLRARGRAGTSLSDMRLPRSGRFLHRSALCVWWVGMFPPQLPAEFLPSEGGACVLVLGRHLLERQIPQQGGVQVGHLHFSALCVSRANLVISFLCIRTHGVGVGPAPGQQRRTDGHCPGLRANEDSGSGQAFCHPDLQGREWAAGEGNVSKTSS